MLGSYKNLSWSTRKSSGFNQHNSSSVSNGGGAGLTNLGLLKASNFRFSSNFSLLSGNTLSLSKMSFFDGHGGRFDDSFLTICVAENWLWTSLPLPLKSRQRRCDSFSEPLETKGCLNHLWTFLLVDTTYM